MAAEAALQDLVEEATCSICLDFFQDPVLIPVCGHNFCRGCLTRSWETSESEPSCPQCRQTFAPRRLLPNRQLARMAEVARQCGGPSGEERGSFCPKHPQHLKLFCKDHETLICLVCDGSIEHKGHWVIPAEEAFLEYQIKVGDCLKARKEQKEKIATYQRDTEQRVQERLDLIKKEEKNVVAEFRELHLWLEGQEKRLLARMEETKKDIMARKEEGLAKHSEELRSLDNLIQEIEEKHQQPASKLLQDIGSILKKYQAKEINENQVDLLLEPKWTIWDYSEMTVLLKSAMKRLRDMLENGPELQKENAILNPYTAHPDWPCISEDVKSIKGLKRFEYNRYILGRETFSSGRHFWDVTVGDATGWCVGVACKPVDLTNEKARHWQVREWEGQYMAISPSDCFELVLTEKPTSIRVSLNCEEGQVTFFDARTAALLHTFSDASLIGETFLPSFYLSDGAWVTVP